MPLCKYSRGTGSWKAILPKIHRRTLIITSGPERKGLTKTVREERLTLFIYIKRKKATQMERRV